MSRDAFLYWWPVLARVAGTFGAFGQAGYAVITHQSADVAFLGFCGVLIAAPTIFPDAGKKEKADGPRPP